MVQAAISRNQGADAWLLLQIAEFVQLPPTSSSCVLYWRAHIDSQAVYSHKTMMSWRLFVPLAVTVRHIRLVPTARLETRL